MPRLSAAEFRQSNYDPQGQWCLLYGSEYELKLRLRDALIERLVAPEDREYAVQTVVVAKGAKAGVIAGAAQTASMLAMPRVLVVDWIENLSASEQRALADNLSVAPQTLVILIEGPRSGSGEDRTRGAAKTGRLGRELIQAVADAGTAVECRALTRGEAVAWVVEQARELGTSIRPATGALLVERVGADLGRLAREVEKLSLLTGGEGEISKRDIEQATPRTPEDNIFAVGDAIGAGDGDQAMAALRDLVQFQGVEPTTALAFIARQIRLIWQAKILLDAGWRAGSQVPLPAEKLLPERSDVRQYLDGRRWLVERLARQARRFSWPQLAYAVRRLLAAELALKGMAEGVADHRIAVEMLVLDLCRWRDSAPGAGLAAGE
jgi:DNA polymerase III delta subunit